MFASEFLSLLLLLSLFLLSLLVLLSSACHLSLWVVLGVLCGLLFLFPLRYMRKKKGRKVLSLASSLVLLWDCSDSCTVIEKLPRCVFGFFQFVRLIMPTNTTGVGWFARFHFDFVRHYVDITYNPSAFLK